jgi:hypothetical protein
VSPRTARAPGPQNKELKLTLSVLDARSLSLEERKRVEAVLPRLSSHLPDDYAKATTFHDGKWVAAVVDSRKVVRAWGVRPTRARRRLTAAAVPRYYAACLSLTPVSLPRVRFRFLPR